MKYTILNNFAGIDKEKWSDFIRNHPDRNAFLTPEMFRMFAETRNYEPIIIACVDNETSEIAGLMAAVIMKEYAGALGKLTARSIVWGAPLSLNNDDTINELLLKEYIKIAGKKAIYTEIRNFFTTNKALFEKLNFEYEEHLNILVNLTISEEALWSGVKSNRKRGIKKGIESKLEFQVTTDSSIVPVFYELLKETYSHIKKPFPKIDHFNKICETLPKDAFQYYSILSNGEIITCMMAFTYQQVIYGYYIGSKKDNEYLKMRPMDLLYWRVMQWGIENNYQCFDWMGAGKPNEEYGVRDFKLQYGGEVVEYGRYKLTHKPLLEAFGKFGLKIWQKLK